MPKSTTFCNDLMALIFNAAAIANIADNASAAPLTNLYVSLHTTDPGIGGSQLTGEVAYTNYGRVAVARTAGGWTVALGLAKNTALISFPQCGVTGATAAYVCIGTVTTGGAGKVLYAGALGSPLSIANLIQPQFAINDLTAQEL